MLLSVPCNTDALNISEAVCDCFTNPHTLEQLIRDSEDGRLRFTPFKWKSTALANGFPGLILFLASQPKVVPHLIHEYVLRLKTSIEKEGIGGLGLFSGVAGICFALDCVYKRTGAYHKLLSTLQTQLLNRIEQDLIKPLETKAPYPCCYYDTMQGLSGIGRYLLEHISSPSCARIVKKIIHSLIQITEPILIEKRQVPGWYLCSSDPMQGRSAALFNKGSFNLGLAHGIPGVLAFLSIAKLRNVELPRQNEAIERIVSWIRGKKLMRDNYPCWPSAISFEQELEECAPKRERAQDAWCYGTPGVARSLMLAGKALDDPELRKFAASAFIGVMNRAPEAWYLPEAMLCHGLSGLLLIAKKMQGESECDFIEIQGLKQRVIDRYDPLSLFGFHDLREKKDATPYRVSNPGFLDGSIGVALTLLSLEREDLPNWDLPFMLA